VEVDNNNRAVFGHEVKGVTSTPNRVEVVRKVGWTQTQLSLRKEIAPVVADDASDRNFIAPG